MLDAQAGPCTQRRLDLLRPDGRLVFLAGHRGPTAEVNRRDIVRRRLTSTGSTLRPRPPSCKEALAAEPVAQIWPMREDGLITMRLHAVFPFQRVADARRGLDAHAQDGKVVLAVAPDQADAIPEPHPC